MNAISFFVATLCINCFFVGTTVLGASGMVEPPAAPTEKAAVFEVEFNLVPNGGIQPQGVAAADGTLHLLYYKGDPKAGDLFYVRQSSTERQWSAAIRVNSEAGSAVAVGNDRGGQIVLGAGGIVHVAWNGASQVAVGKEKTCPMLYSRLLAGKTEFEAQRNVMKRSFELDGGGSVAADDNGNVYVVWHGLPLEGKDHSEAGRRVFVAASTDDGANFAPEVEKSDPAAGVCACCGLKAAASPSGELFVLYRAATEGVHRDMHLMRSQDHGKSFSDAKLDAWERNACPMSTAAIAFSGKQTALAWETDGQIRWSLVPEDKKASFEIFTLGEKKQLCKYPSIAIDDRGRIVVAWVEEMKWNTAGKVRWEKIDFKLPDEKDRGTSDYVAPWSLVSVVARPGRGFSMFH